MSSIYNSWEAVSTWMPVYLARGRSIESPVGETLSFAASSLNLLSLKSSSLGAGLAGGVNPDGITRVECESP